MQLVMCQPVLVGSNDVVTVYDCRICIYICDTDYKEALRVAFYTSCLFENEVIHYVLTWLLEVLLLHLFFTVGLWLICFLLL